MFALALVCSTIIRFRDPIWTQARILYWQRQCMNYEAPLGHVACEELGDDAPFSEKAAVALLLQQGGYEGSASSIRAHAKAFDQFNQLVDPAAYQLRTLYPCLYMHRRRSPGGHDRLVRIDFAHTCAVMNGDAEIFSFDASVFRPAGIYTRPDPLWRGSDLFGTWNRTLWHDKGYFRFFSGTADPADPSHFTIGYDVALVHDLQANPVLHGTIDGWLRDDDSILLRAPRGRVELATWKLLCLE
jgi:hypothetical protein